MTYYTVVHEDVASSAMIRLALDFVRQEAKTAQPIFQGENIIKAPLRSSPTPYRDRRDRDDLALRQVFCLTNAHGRETQA